MDYNNLEELLKDAKKDYSIFMDYLVECSDENSEYSCLSSYANDIRLFKDFAIPLKHVMALTVLEKIAKDNPSIGGEKLAQFKSKFGEIIKNETDSFENLFYYLSENISGITKREKIILLNFDNELLPNENLWDKTKERLFPKELKRPRDFVEIYKEALNDMIYITYKTGRRDRLVSFDGEENHNLASWVLNNRDYDFLQNEYRDAEILSYRMWEIISEKRKVGLFD